MSSPRVLRTVVMMPAWISQHPCKGLNAFGWVLNGCSPDCRERD